MSDQDLYELRGQLAAARAGAAPPEVTLDAIAQSLAEHIRFEVSRGDGMRAEQIAFLRDQVMALGLRERLA